jgi:prepilin-type N-terminal cleavage/methylation domain-containing protein
MAYNWEHMLRKARGFTIVELLVVIVVIAILAAITVVAYNGIQMRAKNVKTVSAATAWIKILKLYNADKGSWPTAWSCLGNSTTYPGSGGYCWGSTYAVSNTVLSQIQPYTSTYPEPDTTDIAAGTADSPRRGILYTTDNSSYWRIIITQIGSGSCPNVGLTVSSGPISQSSGYWCEYYLN